MTEPFKPGMTQIAEGDPVHDPKEPLDFSTLIKKMDNITPVMSMPHRGFGKKCFIQADSKSHRIVVEFFSELVISPAPDNPKVGYQEGDVSQFKGVMITNYEPEKDKDGYHANIGVIMPYEEFVDEYIQDSQIRIKLDRIFDMMEEHTEVDEQFLASATQAWDNRAPGSTDLYPTRYH